MPEVLTQARNLEVHNVPDGYIIYNPEQDRVHYLNKTAAIIFEFCDGAHAADDVVARVAMAFELPSSAHGEVRDGLASLVEEGLVLSSKS
jgi:hypothetical protein